MEEAEIMMTPVCSCGYVFKSLHYEKVCVGSKIVYGLGTFTPNICPKCKRRITNIKTKIQQNENEFVFENN